MSEVERVVKKWSKDVLVAWVVQHSWGDAGALEVWRLERELREAGSEVQALRDRQQAALARNDFAGFESLERLLLSARKRESCAYHEFMSLLDQRKARRDFEERRRAKAPPLPVTSRELALVSPTRASDPDVLDAELVVEDEPPALPKPRLGLPAPRRSLPMQQRRK